MAANMAVRCTEKVNGVCEETELKKLGYACGPTLGQGSYAIVKSAVGIKDHKKFALKIINKKKAPKDFQQKFLPRELDIIKRMDHPNVVKTHDTCAFGGKVYIFMEMAGHGDLLEYIKLRGAISEKKSAEMFRELLDGVDYLHKMKIVHRDLKCENVLLDNSNHIKLSDFGFARFMDDCDCSKTFCGSAAYAAPEILQGKPYCGKPYDVWSMGCILYIMVCGSMPFDDSNIKKMIQVQTQRKVGFSKHKVISDTVKHLIHRMLEANVETRITVAQIYEHPWLAHTGKDDHAKHDGGARSHDGRSRSPRDHSSSHSKRNHSGHSPHDKHSSHKGDDHCKK